MSLIPWILDNLVGVKLPFLLLLVGLAVWCMLTIRAQRIRLVQLERESATHGEVNGLGARVNRIDRDAKDTHKKILVAVATIAQKVDAPEVLKDFLKDGT